MNRRNERKRIDVRIYVHDEEWQGKLWFDAEDISAGGLYLISDFLLEKDTPLTVSFSLPGELREYQLDARVVWVNLGMDPKMNERRPGMGITFTGLDDETKHKIKAFISE